MTESSDREPETPAASSTSTGARGRRLRHEAIQSTRIAARIRAVLRRTATDAETLPARDASRRAYRFDGWELNVRSRRLTAPDGKRIALTNGEFGLLQAFCAAPRRVLSRDQLLELSRLDAAEVYDRSVDVQILRLRRKLEADPSRPRLIRTERGAGYVFDAGVEVLR